MSSLDAVLVADVDYGPAPVSLGDYFSVATVQDPSIKRPSPPHLSVVALGTWLRREGFSVSVHDNVFSVPASREAFLAALDKRPRVVGISTTSMMEPGSIAKLAGWARERSPSSLIVLGGVTAESKAEARACGDVTVLGPGEITLAGLVECLRNGRAWTGLPGIAFARNGREVVTPAGPEPDLESLPVPDWDLLRPRHSSCYSIEASKGCRYLCAFCGDRGLGQQRMRSVASIVREMREVRDRFGATLFRFVDSTLTSWPAHTEELCRALAKERLGVDWSCYARADNFARHPGLAAAMREAGARWVFCGIESGSDVILRGMNKGYGRLEAIKGCLSAREAGLRVHGNFIIGFPGESAATVDETLDLIERARLGVVNFDPLGINAGSVLSDQRDRFGLRVTPEGWSHATMDSAESRVQARRCLDTVVERMEETLPGTEVRISLFLRGEGLSEEEALSYLRAVRDFHRARSRGNERGRLEAAAEFTRLNGLRAERTARFVRSTSGPAPART